MRWSTPVDDAVGRTREIVVEATGTSGTTPGRVTVICPPGGSAGLTPDQAGALSLALASAADWARGNHPR